MKICLSIIGTFQLMGWTLCKPGWLLVYFLSLVSCVSLFILLFENFFAGALFEYSVILLQMKIKTIRQIRKCMNGNLAAYLSPLVGRNNYFLTFLQTLIIIWHDLGVLVTFYQIYMMFKELISSFRPTLWWADLQRRTEQEEVWNMSGNIYLRKSWFDQDLIFHSLGHPGGKRETQGGTSFPAFDPTSKGSQRNIETW